MLAYQPAAARPRVLAAPRSPQLGSMSSLTFTDWGLLLGGAVVGGAGINNLVSQFRGPKRVNAISVMPLSSATLMYSGMLVVRASRERLSWMW